MIMSINIGLAWHLFAPDNTPVTIMKYKELYEHFEDSLDRCEDVADVIEKLKISLS